MGYDSRWGIVSAADVGAPHRRERIWILANTKLYGLPPPQVARGTQETIRKQQAGSHNTLDFTGASDLSTTKSDVAYSGSKGLQGSKQFQNDIRENISGQTLPHGSIAKRNNDGGTSSNWWDAEPNVGRVADGVAARVDRLKAIGNGQVPLCAATAWELLK
jgi:DNA (cytosine-5)-methyltransferase 1